MEAKFLHGKMLVERGRLEQAATRFREVVDEDPDATLARLELARTLDLLGDKDAAWRHVRSVQTRALPANVALLVDRYSEALRAARPAGANFEIAVAPDTNINRSTRSDTLGTIIGDFVIDESDKARTGIGVALRGQAYKRLFPGRSNTTLLVRASGLADLYGRDQFNDVALDLAAGPEIELGRDRINLEIGATQRWYGQKPFVRSYRLGGNWIHPIGARTQSRVTASVASLSNLFNQLQSGHSYSAQASIETAVAPTIGVGATIGADRLDARDPGYSTTGWHVGGLAWSDVGRMTFSVSGQLGRLKADERLFLFDDVRRDKSTRGVIGATFRHLNFHGFAPVVRLLFERNRSSIEFYDYRRTRAEFGIARAF